MQLVETETHNLFLPRLNFVGLNGFSIYKKVGGTVSLDINKSVYCLAGANGLGKSTLLTTIIYGICGYPRRLSTQKVSQSKRQKNAEKQSEEYYLGRLNPSDIGNSTVTVEFDIGNYTYKITRKVYKSDGIESLSIKNKESGHFTYKNDGGNPQKIEVDYQSNIANHSKVGDFSRFVFLVQYVQSFDENHHLLFWDAEALENAIFTCIGLSSKLSKETEDNRNKANQLSSRIRNLQFAKKQTMDVLKATYGLSKNQDIFDVEEAELILKKKDEITDEIQSIEMNIESEKAILTQHSHTKLKLENRYKEIFDQIASGCSHVPLVESLKKSIDNRSCFACGNESDSSISKITEKLNYKKCPICDSDISRIEEKSVRENTEALKDIDNSISKILDLISQSQLKISEFEKALVQQRKEIEEVDIKIKKILPDSFLLEKNAPIDNRIEDMKRQISAIDKKKKELEEQRTEFEKEYIKCYRELEKKYASIEHKFVPVFRELAQQFLGMPVNININKAKSINSQKPMLSIEINGSSRNSNLQLSESQRFFVDIALKMSLIDFCTGTSQNVSMFLDTPEGSLDIAYEEMVGEMFANFISKNKSIFMTANLNSSEILKKLAQRCRNENMEIERMLSWADLSEVQKKSEAKFQKAYEEIASILDGNDEPTLN